MDQGTVAFTAARRARRPGNIVAGAQLAAADLGSGDIDVIGVRLEPVQTQKPVALRGDLERSGHLLGGRWLELLALARRLRLGLGLRPGLGFRFRLGFALGLRSGLGFALGLRSGLRFRFGLAGATPGFNLTD